MGKGTVHLSLFFRRLLSFLISGQGLGTQLSSTTPILQQPQLMETGQPTPATGI